jgi:2-polyprenyl-3-methyl-5-hydroxy-6-metoxy-1,4-benzoquinol methylase
VDLREREQHEQRHPWEVARARFFRRIIKDCCPTPPSTVTDVGSGDGWFASQLRPDLPAAKITCWDVHYTAEDLAQPLPPGIVRTVTPPEHQAQLVLALDVLEHIDDDVSFVADQLRPLVALDGLLVVSVPAHQRLFTSHDVALGHHRRHSAASLALLLNPSFQIVREGSLFTSLLAPRAVSAAVEKVRSPKGEPQLDSAWTHGPVLSRTITAVLGADAALGRLFADRHVRPPGLSVWAVCRPWR